MDQSREPSGGGPLSRRSLLKSGALLGLGAGSASVSRKLGMRTPRRPTPPAYSAISPWSGVGLGPGGALLRPGSRPFPHMPVGTDTMPKIEHIVVLMMENHSFDDHLGMLGRATGSRSDRTASR